MKSLGVAAFLSKEHTCNTWGVILIVAGLFFAGYITGQHYTFRQCDERLERMIQTNTIHLGNDYIELGLTGAKRKEILDAMKEVTEEREQEDYNERKASRERP